MDTALICQKGIGELQRSAERFENYNDGFILPDTFVVVRLDAHRLGDWGDLSNEYPCGPTVTKALHNTARLLMTSSFRVLMAYAHGDEISLLIDPTECTNPIRRSKLLSTISSAAAVHFLKVSGHEALFEGRLSEIPNRHRLVEYFFWQRRYCFRNATTIALRQALLAAGHSLDEAEKWIHGVPEKQRIAKLNEQGVALEQIAHTTRRGALFFWDSVMKDGREHFRIVTDAALSDDDEAFLNHLVGVLNSALGTEVVAASTPPEKRVANSDPEPSPSSQVQQTRESPSRTYRTNKKTNVTVFKMPNNGATK